MNPSEVSPVPPSPDKWDALRKAAEALVEKLELIHADERYKAVWVHYMIHGAVYTGPQYHLELIAAKATLSELRGMERGGEGLVEALKEKGTDFRDRSRKYKNADLWDSGVHEDGKASGVFIALNIVREHLATLSVTEGVDGREK